MVYAVAGTTPNPGHSHSEIQPCSDGEVLQMSGTSWSCVSLSAGGGTDNLGNHIATQNIQLNNNWLSNDGGSEGISIDDNGKVGIGTNSPGAKLDVNGNVIISDNLDVAGKIYGWNVPRDIKITTATHNGNFGGYKAMYDWIQLNGCSGYYVCTANELAIADQFGITPTTMTAGGWFVSAINGVFPITECYDYTSSNSQNQGFIWYNSRSNQMSCNNAYYVMCCK
jgi:hypothetical protein